MSAKTRADLITKLHKYVKKEYDVVSPPSNRTVIEHMLYGCCLQDSTFEAADNAFAKLQENYFDWNEVRVTTVEELAESMKGLADPRAGATSLKKTLHGIFESYYQFDIDFLRKENLSKAVIQFEKFKGISSFIVSYVAQNGLGGHSIPLDRSMMLLFHTLGIASEDEVASGRVPGLERTISKAHGVEFSVLVHQLAVAYSSSPFNTKMRERLLKLAPDAKDRFPKRGGRKKAVEPEPEPEVVTEVVEKPAKETTRKASKASSKKVAPVKNASKKTTKAGAKKKAKPAKPTASKKAKKSTKKKAPARKKLPAKKTGRSKGSTTKKLARKKPR